MVRSLPRRLAVHCFRTPLSRVAGRGPVSRMGVRPPLGSSRSRRSEKWVLWLKRFPRRAIASIFWGAVVPPFR